MVKEGAPRSGGATGAIRKTVRGVTRGQVSTDTSGDEGARANNDGERGGEWTRVQRKKTYAETLGRGANKGGENKEGWKTPPRREVEKCELTIERCELTIEREGKKGQELVREVTSMMGC